MVDTLRDARVVVTGGTGFIGSHLVRRLVAAGARPYLIVRAESDFRRIDDVRPSCDIAVVNFIDDAIADRIRRIRPDVVFHLAGATTARGSDAGTGLVDRDFTRAFEINFTATERLLLALAREAPDARVIRTGGLAEYGVGALPFREDQREEPASPYAASQVAATHLGQAVHRQFGLAVTTLRPALTYGPAQSPTFFIPSLIAACLANRPFAVTSADHTRDFVYVDDVVDALVAASLTRHVAGQVINVGSGRERRIGDIAALIVRLTGARIELSGDDRPRQAGDLARLVCDADRAKHVL